MGGDRVEARVPDEVPKIEMRKHGDARVSPLHYGRRRGGSVSS